MQLLDQWGTIERDQKRLQVDQEQLKAKQAQLMSREKLLWGLAKGTYGQGDTSTVDKAMRICYSKHRELCSTYPMTLSRDGNFLGIRDVLQTSDRALNDVSSALKEVSAASDGGDID